MDVAKKVEGLEFKKNSITFEKDPETFCKICYEEAADRNDDLMDINIENRGFFEGKDEELQKRLNDPDVVRSAIFIPLLKPAIETRKSEIISKFEERRNPIVIQPRATNPTPEMKDKAENIANRLYKQLSECGYLTRVLDEQITAAEIYRTPSAVKVGWEQTEETEAVIEEVPVLQQAFLGLLGRALPEPKVKFVKKYSGGRPYVEWLYPEEFLYQPGVSRFEDSDYVIRRLWLDYHKIYAMALEFGWDIKKLEQYSEEMSSGDKESEGRESQRDRESQLRDTPFRDGYRDGKILLTDFYVRTFGSGGREIFNNVIMVGNKYILQNKPSKYKGILFPYSEAKANKLPGTIEGLSTIDIGKELQRLYNEVFNIYLDGASYSIFPPLLAPTGLEFAERPKISPMAIWRVTDPDMVKTMNPHPVQLPDLPGLMEAIAAKLRDTLNAHDISQGFQAKEYEKATSTKLRAAGAARRSTTVHKAYGEAIIRVCEMVLALNQQYADNAVDFVVEGGVTIDIPSLTNVTDPDADKQDMLLLYAQALQDPLYASPTGKRKLRNLLEDVFRTFRKEDIEQYVPTEEELENDLAAQTQIQLASLAKQTAAEQLAITNQSSAVNKPQQ